MCKLPGSETPSIAFPSGRGESSLKEEDTSHSFRQKWVGTHYEKCDLRDAGLVLDLGHAGEHNKGKSVTELLVLHTNGVHQCHVRICRCQDCASVALPILFLRHQLWAGTVISPKMAVTVAALEYFHQLTLKAKVNAYDYIATLHHLTSNVIVSNTEVSDDT